MKMLQKQEHLFEFLIQLESVDMPFCAQTCNKNKLSAGKYLLFPQETWKMVKIFKAFVTFISFLDISDCINRFTLMNDFRRHLM